MKRLTGFLALLLCVACASPQVQPYHSVNKSEPPALKEKMLVTEGVELPFRSWLPKQKPKAVIVALHGFNDYSHAFEIPGEYFRLFRIGVYAYDQRGFGSAPSHGIWAGEDNLVHDAADMVVAVRKRYPGTPVYLLGESMGGAVAIVAASRPDFPPIDGLILSAPAMWGGETMSPLVRFSLWFAAHTVPDKKLTGEDLHILASDNIDMLRALGSDPLVLKATRVDAIYGLVRLMDEAYNDIDKVKTPMFILYGAHDQVIPLEPIVSGITRAQAGTQAAYYPMGYHMLLRDRHGDVPVRDIVSWVNNKQQPLPSGYDKEAAAKLKAQKPRKSSSIGSPVALEKLPAGGAL